MTPAPICILYTQDAELVRRTRAFLRSMSQLRHVNDPDRLESVLQQTGPSVLMMDLRSKECRELIDQIQNEQPEVLIIAFGVGQSETLREAAKEIPISCALGCIACPKPKNCSLESATRWCAGLNHMPISFHAPIFFELKITGSAQSCGARSTCSGPKRSCRFMRAALSSAGFSLDHVSPGGSSMTGIWKASRRWPNTFRPFSKMLFFTRKRLFKKRWPKHS